MGRFAVPGWLRITDMELNRTEARLVASLVSKEQASLDGTILAKDKEIKELGYARDDADRLAEEQRQASSDLEDRLADAQRELGRLRDRQEELEALRDDLEIAAADAARAAARTAREGRAAKFR